MKNLGGVNMKRIIIEVDKVGVLVKVDEQPFSYLELTYLPREHVSASSPINYAYPW